MEKTTPHPDKTVPVSQAARYFRVPVGWLRGEVEAGRLPGLRAGRATLVHLPTVGKLLADRAKAVCDDRE